MRSSRDHVLSHLTDQERAQVAAGATVKEILHRRAEEGLRRVTWTCPACHDRGHLHGYGRPIRPGVDIPYLAALAGVPVDEIEWCACEAGIAEREGYCRMVGAHDTARIERTFVESGIPDRLRGLSTQTLTMELARGKELALVAAGILMKEERLIPDEIAQRHALLQGLLQGIPRSGDPRFGLLLHGSNGVGKSAIAAIIAEHMIRKGIAVLFIDYHEFIARIQSEYGKDKDGQSEQVLQTAIEAPFLVLDDLGDQNAYQNGQTANRQEIVYRLINLRHQRRRWTVITTNLNEVQIEQQFSRRTYQRLRELCLVVKMGGLNLRDQTIGQFPYGN